MSKLFKIHVLIARRLMLIKRAGAEQVVIGTRDQLWAKSRPTFEAGGFHQA